MSSLFQGLTEPDGRVKVTTSGAGAVPLRGLMVSPDGRVLIAEDTGQARVHHSGRAFDPATGALLVDPAAITEVLGMGGMTVDINGGVITKGVVPSVIHQGVGLTSEGYLAVDRGIPEGSIFYAPLSSDLDEVVASVPHTYIRDLEALYQDSSGKWHVAPANVPRFSFGQILMEPAATNKCENYNANPDAGLTGYSSTGGTLSRVSDAGLIAAAGLENICTDGNVVRFVTAGSAADCIVNGDTNNTNVHRLSAWIQNVQGSVQFLLEDDTGNLVVVPVSGALDRYVADGVPSTTTRRLVIRLGANSEAKFALTQLEQSAVVSTPIITRGASASRGVDRLHYDLAPDYNDAEGSLLFDFVPLWDEAQYPGSNRFLVSLNNVSSADLAYLGLSTAVDVRTYDGANLANLRFAEPVVDGRTYQCFVRWTTTGGVQQVGIKENGVWVYGIEQTYKGSHTTGGPPDRHKLFAGSTPPVRMGNVAFWDYDIGTPPGA